MAQDREQELAEVKPKEAKKGFVRLSINLSTETMDILRRLIEAKGLSITDGVRRAIKVWQFVEEQTEKGNELAVIEPNGDVRKVLVL
ncbi:hypothetical protein ACIBF7_01905 [Nonomuraea sp. NPDC050478]|uniref:CopG family transcriptional regulator n=1 Tax=unclassified Nonomuraea TaxID=2593643 RepID=UPI0011CD7188|nr:CopG family transcriptional regulator [Nonomuraea sp. C10]TXK34477.1 CopG family transcriptional regulator [Nonomuraea sp. C10]